MKFQTLLLVIFGTIGVVALIVFSTSDPKNKSDKVLGDATGNVEIWGTFEVNDGNRAMVDAFNLKYGETFTISYHYHDPANFDRDIVEALASGKGPDILLLPDNLVMRHGDKINLIPYASFPSTEFSSMFIQAAEVYKRGAGLVALPFAVDPMVMYWNRDIFNNASITQPPKYWEEFLSLAPTLTKINPKTRQITQSTIAFGEYANVNHAKDLLSMLFLQVGNPIVSLNERGPYPTLNSFDEFRELVPDQGVVSAFRFFMDFSDPAKRIYSWSRARSNALDEFIDGNLAVHFDYASAYDAIKRKNPHLNFAVALIPQPKDTAAEVTIARIHGLSILKSSDNPKTALIAVGLLLREQAPAKQFAEAYNLPPVRRDLLEQKPTDSAFFTFYDAAIRARTWLDPKPEESDKIFREGIDDVSSGRLPAEKAIQAMQEKLGAALEPYVISNI